MNHRIYLKAVKMSAKKEIFEIFGLIINIL